MSTTTQPNTRRTLRFNSLDEVTAEVQKLANAEQSGKLRTCGNWTFGQNLGHLATWVDYSFDGVPLKIPFFIRWILRPMKRTMLTKPMKPGARIPRVKGGTLAIDVVSTADGLAHFHRAFERLGKGPPSTPHLLFGPMTHDEWIAQHLRHSELHLSFFTIDS
jgi:hypothetical protein